MQRWFRFVGAKPLNAVTHLRQDACGSSRTIDETCARSIAWAWRELSTLFGDPLRPLLSVHRLLSATVRTRTFPFLGRSAKRYRSSSCLSLLAVFFFEVRLQARCLRRSRPQFRGHSVELCVCARAQVVPAAARARARRTP